VTGTGGEARLYLDEDIPYRAADVATALGLDAIAARDAHRSLPQDDAFHLQTAAADRRVMVTYNRDDFLVATRDAFAAGLPHAGLLVLTRKLPRDSARIGHALDRWVRARFSEGRWPMQPFEVDFLSE
jgi:predicted nuclease of predicted toxin-antitoxin system